MQFISKVFLYVLAFVLVGWASSPTAGPDRPYTLQTLSYTPMLYHFHEMTQGSAPQSYFYPQRDSSWRRGQALQDSTAALYWQHDNAMIATSIVGGFDFRGGESLGDTIMGYDGGLYLRGYKDSVEFWVDARLFNEKHSSEHPRSWDREFLEVQKEENNSGVGYTSYARYRGHFTVNMGWSRLDFARDVQHWGPGYYNNLTLNQYAVPYNQMSLETQVGPLTVLSLYGDLRIDASSMSDNNVKSRNLYGHRYELNIGNTMVGVSELTVLYDLSKPWLFIPIVPLFMEKGQFSENRNNGSISFDISQRFNANFRLYSEFFIDDFESPISLVRNDNIEAKWAWMGGAQIAQKIKGFDVGTLVEYARVEPYVYSHFVKSTAQFEHLGQPLGAPAGPNSQVIDWNVYGRYTPQVQMQLHHRWAWKGSDYGSAINDTTPSSNHYKTPKTFLTGAKMQYTFTPAISYEHRYFSISTEYSFGANPAFCSRLGFKW